VLVRFVKFPLEIAAGAFLASINAQTIKGILGVILLLATLRMAIAAE
jgi:hypothetical protein